jgi:hypothetical protein
VERQEPLPRWAWPVIGVALVGLALFAWSLRLQQGRSLEVRDPDNLIGPAELVEWGALGTVERLVADGPFVRQGRLVVPFAANPCPRVRLDVTAIGAERVQMAMRATNGDCDDVQVRWAVLVTPEDQSLVQRSIELVPLADAPPRRAVSGLPYGTWSPPHPSVAG